MDQIVDGIARFKSEVFPAQGALYKRLASEGQEPVAMVISCSDSRVAPEVITQTDPGTIFVSRNAGNVVPPFSEHVGGVTSAIEYAVVGLGIEHIVIIGHTDCGAMKALLQPEALKEMPSVAKWLNHCRCAQDVFNHVHKGRVSDKDAVRTIAMENVVAQLTNLRTHPCVASRLATGKLTLHGWIFDIAAGTILAVDGATGQFEPLDDGELPVALAGARRSIGHSANLIAAE